MSFINLIAIFSGSEPKMVKLVKYAKRYNLSFSCCEIRIFTVTIIPI